MSLVLIENWIFLLSDSLGDLGVIWEAKNIIIDNCVRISPPYQSDNCEGSKSRGSPDQMVKQMKKLVEKFWSDQKSAANNNTNAVVVVGGGAGTPVAKSPNSVQPTDKPPFNNNKG